MSEHSHGGEVCVWCGLDYDFELPSALVEACRRGNMVIFAGAGISTEVPAVFPETLYEEIRAELNCEADSFPQVMARYQEQHGRSELVRKVKRKFDYVDSFPNSRRAARRFHRELATIPFVNDIITTNWDTYFEEECLATPIVKGDDIALLNLYPRKVFKLHGSIANLSSLVVTEEDYAESISKLGQNVLGAHVKELLSSKTVVFIGYSLTDWNFRRIYDSLRSDMGKFAPKSYFVSPFHSERAVEMGLHFLQTSGVKFLRGMKEQLGYHCMISDDKYEEIRQLWEDAAQADEVAKLVPLKTYPSVAYCWAYLDGLTDACFRISLRRGSGEYSNRHHVLERAKQYDGGAERAYDRGRYQDCAYMEGYTAALIVLLAEEEDRALENTPLYFLYGSETELRTEEDFKADLERSRRRAPKERAFARRIVEGLDDNMVLEHSRLLPDLFE